MHPMTTIDNISGNNTGSNIVSPVSCSFVMSASGTIVDSFIPLMEISGNECSNNSDYIIQSN